jgi:hypothetical protein
MPFLSNRAMIELAAGNIAASGKPMKVEGIDCQIRLEMARVPIYAQSVRLSRLVLLTTSAQDVPN